MIETHELTKHFKSKKALVKAVDGIDLTVASGELVDGYYAGLNDIDTQQSLVYLNSMSMNYGEIVLVQVTNSADVATVKTILQNRVSYMAGDGNGPGGAWYPETMEEWENNSEIVVKGNAVCLFVGENKDDMVSAFNSYGESK